MATAELVLDVQFDADDVHRERMSQLYADVCVRIVRVTPQLAATWLERNTKNRPLNKRHVKHLTQVMLDGDMVMNGETIIFDRKDKLLNGQHRLHGCIDSGVSFDAMVVYGIDEEAFKTLDGGRKRSGADVLAMNGEANYYNIASAVQCLIAFVDFGGNVLGTTTNARKATGSVCERVLRAHPGLRKSVQSMRTTRLYDNQHGYVLHYLFSTVDEPLAEAFRNVLAEGDTDMGRPFVRLRESMILNAHRTELRRSYAAKAIKAFNAERAKERPKMLVFKEKTEDFPSIDGLNYEWLAESVG